MNNFKLIIPDDWNGDATIELKEGKITISSSVRTEGGSDDEFINIELSEENTLELYNKLKKYYGKIEM